MWGWTDAVDSVIVVESVFPTHVGVDRVVRVLEQLGGGIPHACGGGPPQVTGVSAPSSYSPRMWGWTAIPYCLSGRSAVFPTHVGVDR